MPPIIKVTDLSKSYTINHEGKQRYTALRDVVNSQAKKLFSFPKSLRTDGNTKEEFFALKDINFEIEQGDRVGIIGRNGAGKSTLLKILSRITEPTKGRVELNGRVASLLEVGTGFHPELTGRENIFLNGAILGMSRSEIRKKFDEIVDFSEVEVFLDTPVKKYSSGMYVRLAFAVAAHLEPEILIVDEVLAVGDSQFQKKCLGKMENISKGEGRTVLFVSHNMGSILNLCNKGILINSGITKSIGDIKEVVDKYSIKGNNETKVFLPNIEFDRRGERKFAEIKSISVFNSNQVPANIFGMGESIVFRLEIIFKSNVKNPRIGLILRNSFGTIINDYCSGFEGFEYFSTIGTTVFEIIIPSIAVYPGSYTIGPWIQEKIGIPSDDYYYSCLELKIIDKKMLGHSEAHFDLITKEGTESYNSSIWKLIAI